MAEEPKKSDGVPGWSEFTGYQLPDGRDSQRSEFDLSSGSLIRGCFLASGPPCRTVIAHQILPEQGELVTREQLAIRASKLYPCKDHNLNPHRQRCDDIFNRGIMRSALIVDVHSLYMGCSRKYPGRVLNYADLTSYYAAQGNTLFVKLAYGRQSEDSVPQFAKILRRQGFNLTFGGGAHNVEMALAVADLINTRSIDHLILGTNYFEAVHLLSFARSRGVYTSVFGFDIPRAFEEVSTVLEVAEAFTQARPETETQ